LQLTVDSVVLEPTHEDVVNGRPGHDAQLPHARDGPRERPPGYGDAHATLDEPRNGSIRRTRLSHVPPRSAAGRAPWRVPLQNRSVCEGLWSRRRRDVVVPNFWRRQQKTVRGRRPVRFREYLVGYAS
jgi:hypothetical protein